MSGGSWRCRGLAGINEMSSAKRTGGEDGRGKEGGRRDERSVYGVYGIGSVLGRRVFFIRLLHRHQACVPVGDGRGEKRSTIDCVREKEKEKNGGTESIFSKLHLVWFGP